MKLSRQQRRRICQVAGKALVARFTKTETKAERQQDRKELARRMFKRATEEDYAKPQIVEPDTRLVVPDTRIVVPDFSMVEK